MKVRTAAIAMSAVAAAVVLAGCTDDTHGDEQTLKLTEVSKRATAHPVGDPWPEANKPGGGFSSAIPLEDASGKRAGELNTVCIFTQGKGGKGEVAQCTGTADVPGGQLVLDRAGVLGKTMSGAIIGGTGKYAGATGTFESVEQGRGTILDNFNVTLP
jgi:hypothetical protein